MFKRLVPQFKSFGTGRAINVFLVILMTGTALLWRGSVKTGNPQNTGIFIGVFGLCGALLGLSIMFQWIRNRN